LYGGVFKRFEHFQRVLVSTFVKISAVDREIALIQVSDRSRGVFHEVELPD